MARIRKLYTAAHESDGYSFSQWLAFSSLPSAASTTAVKVIIPYTFYFGSFIGELVLTGTGLNTPNGKVTKVEFIPDGETTPSAIIDQLGAGVDIDLFTGNSTALFVALFPGTTIVTGTNGDDIANFDYKANASLLDGNDKFGGSQENDRADGGAGDDDLGGGLGADTLLGGIGNDKLYGEYSFEYPFGGADTLHGGDGNDILDGGVGADELNGESGNDILIPFTAFETGDVLDGGTGADLAILRFASTDTTSRTWNFTGANTSTGIVTNGLTLKSIEALSYRGTAGVDTVTGTTGNDVIEGASGTDVLRGGSGDDILCATYNAADFSSAAFDLDAADQFFGGAGIDTAVMSFYRKTTNLTLNFSTLGAASNLTLFDGKLLNSIEQVSVLAGSGKDTVTGGTGNDRLFGAFGADMVSGGGGDDIIGHDFEFGVQMNAPLAGDPAVLERLNGGAGTDMAVINLGYSGAAASYDFSILSTAGTHGFTLAPRVTLELNGFERVYATADLLTSAITLTGMNQTGANVALGDTLVGSDGGSILLGLAGNDRLIGGNGNDTLNGGTGADYMQGGIGDDTYIVDNAGDVVIDVIRGLNGNTIRSSVSYTLNLFVGSLILTGAANLNATGNASDSYLIGNTGNNILLGLDGVDVLTGGVGNDTLNGGAGIDWADYVAAGASANLSIAGQQNTGTAGLDTLIDIENLLGGAGNDTFTGDNFANILNGGNGLNTLNGGGGNDILIGGAGNDIFNGGAGTGDLVDFTGASIDLTVSLLSTTTQNTGLGVDRFTGIENLTGGNGLDRFTGSNAANSIVGRNGNDVLRGMGGNDFLDGGAGNDTLDGGSGNDVIEGGGGNNLITGGMGADTMSGEGLSGDVQTYIYNSVAESGIGALADRILDFTAFTSPTANDDKIDLSAVDADSTLSGRQSFEFVASLTGAAGEIAVIVEVGLSRVVGEVDGLAGYDFEIVIVNGTVPDVSNFIL